MSSVARGNVRSLWSLAVAGALCLTLGPGPAPLSASQDVPQPPAAGEALLISEFRVRGPNGANDEFIEIYNNSNAPHTVAAASGTGYGVAASDGTTRCTILNGTVIPARGYFLCVNSTSYSLSGYPAGSGLTATGNATYTQDIPDNAGIALFNNNTGGGSYSLANRFDAVGSTTEANAIYKEGTGYTALTPFSIDYSFSRRVPSACYGGCGLAAAVLTAAGPSSSLVVDTDNNAVDFLFVDTNGVSAGAGQRLGAPGPSNLSSPVSSDGSGLTVSKLDPCPRVDEPPNQVRDFTSDPANNSTFGTLDVRRTFTNTTGTPITRLRFRILDVTTFPAPSGVADLRPRTSTAVVVTVDRPPCASGTSNVTVLGTTLEQPPNQGNGSGFNGSMSVSSVTPGTPLAAGASIDVRFLLGIQQTGAARFCVAAETLPMTGAQIFCAIGPTNTSTTFANAAAITINDSTTATPYPSNIVVSGIAARVTKVRVTLNNMSHTFPGDVDVLLVGPTGVKLLLMSDTGGGTDWPGVTYTFDSEAATTLSSAFSPTGTYRPTNLGTGDTFPAPAPSAPYLNPEPTGTDSLTAFNGKDPNGTWSLYVVDDAGTDTGLIAGGWELNLETAAPPPMTFDFNGDKAIDRAVYRPSTGQWFVHGQAVVAWGLLGDVPVPGDYNGDAKGDIAVYRPSSGHWFVKDQGGPVQWGLTGDIPVPGDYAGSGKTEIAVYRPSTGQWFIRGQAAIVTWGLPGDVPVPGDYDGDLDTDVAVYRPSTGLWLVQGKPAVQWGTAGDVPIVGDYNGDFVTDRAVYRPSTGQWFVHGQGAAAFWGLAGDVPVPGDYNSDGTTDRAVYRPSTGQWFVQGQATVQWGAPGDLPVLRPEVAGDVNEDGATDSAGFLGDYDGNGSIDVAVYRPSTGEWFVNGQATVVWGLPGDIPVPGKYGGGAVTNRAIYRPSTGEWIVQGQGPVVWGAPGDTPVPGDYDGNGVTDFAVYRRATGEWFVAGLAGVQFGNPGDVPVPGNYDGNLTTDIAVYRPSTGEWFVRGLFNVAWGFSGDVPIPGDYNGDGTTDVAVYRPSSGEWFVPGLPAVQWGAPGDLAVPGDFNGDGLTDVAVYRPSNGFWFVRNLFSVPWGVPGDIPASRAYAPR